MAVHIAKPHKNKNKNKNKNMVRVRDIIFQDRKAIGAASERLEKKRKKKKGLTKITPPQPYEQLSHGKQGGGGT